MCELLMAHGEREGLVMVIRLLPALVVMSVTTVIALGAEAGWAPTRVLDETTYDKRAQELPERDSSHDAYPFGLRVRSVTPGSPADRLGMTAGALLVRCEGVPLLSAAPLVQFARQERRLRMIMPEGEARDVTVPAGRVGFVPGVRWLPHHYYASHLSTDAEAGRHWRRCAAALYTDPEFAETALWHGWQENDQSAAGLLLAFCLLARAGDRDQEALGLLPEVTRIAGESSDELLKLTIAMQSAFFHASRSRYGASATALDPFDELAAYRPGQPLLELDDDDAYRSSAVLPDGPSLRADMRTSYFSLFPRRDLERALDGGRLSWNTRSGMRPWGIFLGTHPSIRCSFDLVGPSDKIALVKVSMMPSLWCNMTHGQPGLWNEPETVELLLGQQDADRVQFSPSSNRGIIYLPSPAKAPANKHVEIDRTGDRYEIRVDGVLAVRWTQNFPWGDTCFIRFQLEGEGSIEGLRVVSLDGSQAIDDQQVRARGRGLISAGRYAEAVEMLDQPEHAHSLRMEAIIPCLKQDPPDRERALALLKLNAHLIRETMDAKEIFRLVLTDDVARSMYFDAVVAHELDAEQNIAYAAVDAYLARGAYREALWTARRTLGIKPEGEYNDLDRWMWIKGYCCAALLGESFEISRRRPPEAFFPKDLDPSSVLSVVYGYLRGVYDYESAQAFLAATGDLNGLYLVRSMQLAGKGDAPAALALLEQRREPIMNQEAVYPDAGSILSYLSVLRAHVDEKRVFPSWRDPLPALEPKVLAPPDEARVDDF